MHIFNMATILIVSTLIGVEFSVTAFVNPAAWRLEAEPQLKVLRRLAFVLGRVMPVWYSICALLLGIQTWVHWHTASRGLLLAADALWVLASIGGILLLVPLNSRITEGDADWQRLSRTWDKRHRVRTALLATAAILLACVVVR